MVGNSLFWTSFFLDTTPIHGYPSARMVDNDKLVS